jgi:hypothetical protein
MNFEREKKIVSIASKPQEAGGGKRYGEDSPPVDGTVPQ